MWAANEFRWPPSVTREQTYRDMLLLYEAAIARG